MKTAMQELIELLEIQKRLFEESERYTLADGIGRTVLTAKQFLIKEKEQSIGLIEQAVMFMSVVNQDEDVSKMDIEDVYNTYFNQNK